MEPSTSTGAAATSRRDAVARVETALVRDFAPGEGAAAGAARPDLPEEGWVPAPVPGDLHRALVAAGRIEEPFYDRNEERCAWVEEREWWYRLRLEGPDAPEDGERLLLVFEGLDTYATVYLDGEVLGTHANMFRPASFDVTGRLEPGREHVLAICFDPPLTHAGPDLPGQWAPFNHERVWMRKAQYGYGWDWGPRLPTVGLWRPVELRRQRLATLRGVRCSTLQLAEREALVEIAVEAERVAGEHELAAAIVLRGPGGDVVAEHTLAVGPDGAQPAGRAHLTLRDPQLWWTHDLGEAALHELHVTLLADGEAVDEVREHVGVRTVELDQRPDMAEPGTRFFRFVLNGVPIFARGANWIPADSFVANIGADVYDERLRQARDANMNMLRVWGGGIYEHDVFYDLCDRLGLLVWQDFMFSCAMYPEDELAAEVDLEARAQVRRLRNHPSLALWCGNNENQWLHDLSNPDERVNRVPGALFYDEILPRAVAELDPRTPYWPGSPYGGDDHNGREDGDVHNWEVWHGGYPRRFGERAHREPTPESVSFVRYAEDTGRFISEFGILSAPDRETLRRWIAADQLFHHSESMDHHTKDKPKNKVDMLLESVTGVPTELDDFVDFSMIAQAEALKFGVEHFRRRRPHCSGTLIWQLNDCWPGLSWALVDYHGFEKAAYHAVRRAYAPVLASFRLPGDGSVELWVTNDTPEPVADTARVRLGRFAGQPVHEQDVDVSVAPHASRRVARWDPGVLTAAPDRYLAVSSAAGAFARNRAFFDAIKDLDRAGAHVDYDVVPAGDGKLDVRLRSDRYAYFVAVAVPDERVRCSDNYVELEPGEERTITLSGPADALRADDVVVRWR